MTACLTERQVQRLIVAGVRQAYPTALIYHVPNGGHRDGREAAGLVADGVVKGAPDLLFHFDGLTLGIEVKAASGDQSKAQRAFEKAMTRNGIPYRVVYSAKEALQFIQDHLSVHGGSVRTAA